MTVIKIILTTWGVIGDGHRMVGDRVLESAHDRKRGWQGRG